MGGIENNSDGRRFVWTVEGWAGTHRLAVMWTGDDSGSMDYVRWQIPTFIGAGFSAMAHVSGDVDGIFGGSPEVRGGKEGGVRRRARRWLWLARTQLTHTHAHFNTHHTDSRPPTATVLRARPAVQGPHLHHNGHERVGGWVAGRGSQCTFFDPSHAHSHCPLTLFSLSRCAFPENPDKQPWTWGEPYTTYNRAALKLKSRLTPYMYSLSRLAYDTGVPPIRALLLEFPTQEAFYTPSNASSYTFMSGPWLLVAPVHTQGALTRDDIPLPAGALWVDWWDGTVYQGNQTLNNYTAPLDVLPLLVRGGAILPLWPEVNFPGQAPADPMYLELWPAGDSAFELYEDDGVTRGFATALAFARTAITLSAPAAYLTGGAGAANVTLAVAPAVGSFPGQLAARAWWLNVRCRDAPLDVVLASAGLAGGAPQVLAEMNSEAQLEAAPSGWYHDTSLQPGAGGLLMVKLPSLAAADGFSVTLSNGPSYPHIGTEACDTTLHHQVEPQKFAWDSGAGTFAVVQPPPGGGAPQCLTVGKDKDNESHTRALEVQPCAPALAAAQQFTLLPASGQLALRADPTQCLDQDVSDMRVILYGCHDPGSPGNQAWAYNATSQHLQSLQNGDCMCVLPPSA